MTEGTMSQMDDVSGSAKSKKNASADTSQTTQHTIGEGPAMAKDSVVETDTLITLVRRAPALAALREQPLDRRDLEEHLGVSKPTIHRLTRTFAEMGLVERTNRTYVLTRLGETVADVVAEFTQSVETAYRLAPLLEAIQYRHSTLDITAFADATVTTAEPGDPYRPVRRYYSFVERTESLYGFDTTTPSPKYISTVHQQIRDGMETEFIYQPDVADRLLSEYSDWMTELFESGHFVLRVHPNLPHGLAIFDERIAITNYCETTGALRALIDINSSAAREWAEEVYRDYRAEATNLSEHSELSQR